MKYRQGDIMFVLVEKLPEVVDPHSLVVALGEKTGHEHKIVNGLVVEDKNDDGRLYVMANTHTIVTHQEHAKLMLPKGFYKVIRQREYDGTFGWREVLD